MSNHTLQKVGNKNKKQTMRAFYETKTTLKMVCQFPTACVKYTHKEHLEARVMVISSAPAQAG